MRLPSRFRHPFFVMIFVLSVLFPVVAVLSTPATADTGNLLLTLHFIDVGQGDAIFVDLPNGEDLLVDTGSPSAAPGLVHYLQSRNVRKIDHLIITHPHDDHMGGIFSILAAFDVALIYDNGLSNYRSVLYGDYLAAVRKRLSRYRILQAGESLTLGKVRADVLGPLLPPTGNVNADSVVLRLRYGDVGILLTGDMGTISEQRILEMSSDLKTQIMKVSHHGENDASSEEFLEAVKPEILIITVERANKYGRPHRAVLERLNQRGARIYRTDRNGSIIVRTDGKTYTIDPEK